MNKAQLKQLIKEVIQEINERPDLGVDIDLSKLGKGLTGKLEDVPINYVHTDVVYSRGEEESMDSPGADEGFDFRVTYMANEDTFDSFEPDAKLVLKAKEEIPRAAIDPKQVEQIDNEIIEKFKEDARSY